MVKDSEAIDKVVPMIIELSKNETKQHELKENIKKLAITNADDVIAREILRAIE